MLVDNGSVQPETQTLMERLARRDDIVVLPDDAAVQLVRAQQRRRRTGHRATCFSFSTMTSRRNEPGWIDVLAAQAMRAEVGAVGARLLYPDRRLQHCGVVIGMGGAADHVLAGLDEG